MIGQAMGAYTDATHGMTLAAVSLPYYRHIMPYGLAKFARFARSVWDIDTNAMTERQAAEAGLNAMESWMKEIGVVMHSSELGVTEDNIEGIALFPFSLVGKAKAWFYKDKEAVDTWDKCAAAFLAKFFPMGKTNALRARIASFQQTSLEPIPEAWERLQEYIRACPHHGMEDWLVLQNFYNGLLITRMSQISKKRLKTISSL